MKVVDLKRGGRMRPDRTSLLTIFVLLACILAVYPAPASAQVADNVNSLEMTQVVHTPTAGVLKQGQYQIDLTAFGNGGAMGGIGIGLFNRFMFGISYGGEGLIGYGDPKGNKLPGVIVKYRVIEESMSMPALTVGFDMQGHGTWYEGSQRYLFKAPGGFVAMSRNWLSNYGRFGVHLGVNYNTIEAEDQQSIDGFAGIDFSINEQLAILAEYDLAMDDNQEDNMFGEGPGGYLNLGLRMTFAQSLVLQFDFTDVLNVNATTPGIGREIKIVYVETFSF